MNTASSGSAQGEWTAPVQPTESRGECWKCGYDGVGSHLCEPVQPTPEADDGLAERVAALADDYAHSAKFYAGWPDHAGHVGRSKAYSEAESRLRALLQPSATVRGERDE